MPASVAAAVPARSSSSPRSRRQELYSLFDQVYGGPVLEKQNLLPEEIDVLKQNFLSHFSSEMDETVPAAAGSVTAIAGCLFFCGVTGCCHKIGFCIHSSHDYDHNASYSCQTGLQH